MRNFQGKKLVVATHNDGKLEEVREAYIERMSKALLPVQSACQAVKAAHEKQDREAAATVQLIQGKLREAKRELKALKRCVWGA